MAVDSFLFTVTILLKTTDSIFVSVVNIFMSMYKMSEEARLVYDSCGVMLQRSRT
jgi:hypothetical protein